MTGRPKAGCRIRPLVAALCLALPGIAAAQQAQPGGLQDWVKLLQWRSIGPATMGGRVTSISVYEKDPTTYWVGTGGGGLLKTTNNGVTFEHQFDREATVAIGAVAVAPSDPNVVYVGTGENNPRNSVSWGDGVYRSKDGGKTWRNVGLKQSFQVGDIVVHPTNPNVAYVAALGRLWGPNKERGVFKTTNGGETWEHALFVDEETGAIDLSMNPADPETLLAAMWERRRDGFDSHRGTPAVEDGYDAYDPIKKWGKGSGIYRTTNGGKTWQRIAEGLPTSKLGRIGLDWYRKDPRVVFAVVDCEKIGMGTPPSRVYLGIVGQDQPGGGAVLRTVSTGGPAERAGLRANDVVMAVEGTAIADYNALLAIIRTRKAGDVVRLSITRGSEKLEISVTLVNRPLGAGTGGGPGGGSPLIGLLRALVEDVPGGVRLGRLLTGGAAETAQLREGDIIRAVDGVKIDGSTALLTELQKRQHGDRVRLEVEREGRTRTHTLTLTDPSIPNQRRPWSANLGGQAENAQDQQGPNSHEYGGVYRSDDGGLTWKRINSLNPRPMYFSRVHVDPSDDRYLYVLGVSLHRSKDGGKTFTSDGSRNVHADQHDLWINPRDGRHMIVGTDGGFYVTYDRMERWDHLCHLALGQFYHVTVDSRKPYRVIGGLQDNGSWSGPSRTLSASGALNEDWYSVGGGDGFVCRVDPRDPDLVYFESQDGNIQRRHLRTGQRASLRPRTQRGRTFRFNWNTPFILSHHNPGILYSGGNYVFRSIKQGEDPVVISPEIARMGRGTATALAESPINPEVLWAGTDDGNLWVTRDGGLKWSNVAERVKLAGPRWVASIEASRYVEGRAYVAFDGHRSDDDAPYAYVTEDFGETWKSLRGNLPEGSTRVLREDIRNPNLLYAGTEFAAWASLDRGASWVRLNTNLPTVAIFEFAQHPTAGEIVAATHGRSLWILDVSLLRQISAGSLAETARLYAPGSVVRWRSEPNKGSPFGSGHRRFIGENPDGGADLFFSLKDKAQSVRLEIRDAAGSVLRELTVPTEPGLHRVRWDLARGPARPAGGGAFAAGGRGGPGAGVGGRRGRGGAPGATPTGAPAAAAGGQGAPPAGQPRATGGGVAAGAAAGFGGPRLAGPGVYRVVLTVDGREYSQTLQVEADPEVPEASQQPGVTPDEELREAVRTPGRPVD